MDDNDDRVDGDVDGVDDDACSMANSWWMIDIVWINPWISHGISHCEWLHHLLVITNDTPLVSDIYLN